MNKKQKALIEEIKEYLKQRNQRSEEKDKE